MIIIDSYTFISYIVPMSTPGILAAFLILWPAIYEPINVGEYYVRQKIKLTLIYLMFAGFFSISSHLGGLVGKLVRDSINLNSFLPSRQGLIDSLWASAIIIVIGWILKNQLKKLGKTADDLAEEDEKIDNKLDQLSDKEFEELENLNQRQLKKRLLSDEA